MRRHLIIASAVLALMTLTACSASTGTASPTPTPTRTAAPSPSPSPTESTEPPVEKKHVVLGVDGLTFGDAYVDYNEGNAVMELLAEALGETPEGIPDPTGYPSTTYEWDGVTLYVGDNGATTVLLNSDVQDPEIFTTDDGISLGSTVDELLAAGAKDMHQDGNGDGIDDSFRLGVQEVPGTVPYEDLDGVGTKFVSVTVVDDVVVGFTAPANDYSDA